MSAPDFSGKYTLERNENFDEFLAENGVPWMARKMAGMATPTLDVQQDGKSFIFKLASRMQSRDVAFTVGQEYEEKQPNDVIMKVCPSLEDNKLVLTYTPLEQFRHLAKPQVHTREVSGNTLTLTLQVGDLTAKRIFQKDAS